MATISIQAHEVYGRPRQPAAGKRASNNLHDASRTVIASDGQAKQVGSIVVDTAADNTTYTWTLNGIVQTYISGTGASVSSIASGIAAVIDADPRVRGQVSPSASSATVTLTSVIEGLAFTLSDSDGNLTTTESSTANASANTVAFGVLVMALSMEDGVYTGGTAKSSGLTAQVDTLTVTYAAGERYTVSIEIEGQTYQVSVDADTDLATTRAAIAAAINGIMPANTVLADGSSGSVVTLTAEVAGKAFVTGYGSKTGGNLTLANTTGGPATDIARAAAGVALYRADLEAQTIGGDDALYQANDAVECLYRGEVWVASSESISPGDDVYVELGSSNSGQFYKSASSTRVRLPRSMAQWVRDGDSNLGGSGLALLRVSM